MLLFLLNLQLLSLDHPFKVPEAQPYKRHIYSCQVDLPPNASAICSLFCPVLNSAAYW
jgi:hypothetical protein